MFKHTHIDTSEMYTVYQLVPVCQRTPLTSSFAQAVRSAKMKKLQINTLTYLIGIQYFYGENLL